MATIEELLMQHREEDDKRFDALTNILGRVDTNVLSLMETRAYQRGVLRTVIYVSGIVSVIAGPLVTFAIAYLRGH